MAKTPEKRVCPHCSEEFIPRRNNQLFDSRKCRVDFHNKNNNGLRLKLNLVNKKLLNNYKILDYELSGLKSVERNRYFLRGRGFSFQHITHIGLKIDEGEYSIYDIKYKKINNDQYLIFR